MPSINEILNLAKMSGFEYAIMFIDQTGEVKVAIGLNGLTKRISDAINSYIRLLENFNVKFTKLVYSVKDNKEISILDIPMYFTIVEDTSGNNFLPRPSGYM
jgi:hypothetical protein